MRRQFLLGNIIYFFENFILQWVHEFCNIFLLCADWRLVLYEMYFRGCLSLEIWKQILVSCLFLTTLLSYMLQASNKDNCFIEYICTRITAIFSDMFNQYCVEGLKMLSVKELTRDHLFWWGIVQAWPRYIIKQRSSPIWRYKWKKIR